MSQTVTATTNDSAELTGLAYAISEIDTKYDSRDCPHDCHGSLSVDDEGRVLCETCRCTPDGVYLPPEDDSSTNKDTNDGGEGLNGSKSYCSQYKFFETRAMPSSTFNPHTSRWDNALAEYNEHENTLTRDQYRNSGRRKVVGSFEEAWPQEKTTTEDSLI